MTRVPYEKGGLFLTALEKAVGRVKLDAFLKGYFDHFAFKSITTADFVADLETELFPKAGDDARPIDLRAWLHEPGIPADAPEPRSERFAAGGRPGPRNGPLARLSAADLPKAEGLVDTLEWLHFLHALPAKLPAGRMTELDNAYDLTDRGNCEIAQLWLVLAVRNGYKASDTRLEDFLTSIGRRKYLMPLYAELAKTPEGKARALAIYKKARPFYHPISVDSVDKLLGRSE